LTPLLLATTLALHPFELVRVDDPDHPDADATSATGAVLLAPPAPGTPWLYETVPEVDRWKAVEALEALNADSWHERGITGAGVRVAVFDLQWFGAEGDPDELGPFTTHDCYAHPSCALAMDTWRPRFFFEEGVHGYACAEVLHDIAPDATLHLVRVNGQTTLENAVDWAVREGIDVVSMSMSFFNASFYDGTGRVSVQMERARAGGVLMVVSAGNYADSHWHGRLVDSDLDGRMEFDGEDGLWIYLNAGARRGIYLTWDQFRTCGTTDLDAILYDSEGRIVERSLDRQDPDADRCEPVERLTGRVEEDGWYRLEVLLERGAAVALDVDVLATRGDVHGTMAEGSIADPGVSPAAFTVGAVRAAGYLTNDVEAFSSRGPSIAGVAKPDIAGPDGLSTDAYGPVGFYGTSAAAPAVAGAVALVMSEDPTLTPFQAARRLQGWAAGDDIVFFQPDPRWGAGRARLPAEADEAPGCGHRPLLLPLLLPPLVWFRRRRHSNRHHLRRP
jgi:hypothetical protein